MLNERAMRQSNSVRISYRWHRKLGVILAVPVVLIIISGIVLNHGPRLKLDQVFVTNPIVLDWYGMTPKSAPSILQVDGVNVSQLENILFINGEVASENFKKPVGAVAAKSSIIVASPDSLLVFNRLSHALVESLGRESLPPGLILAISGSQPSTDSDVIRIDTQQGRFRAKLEDLIFEQEDRAALTPSTSAPHLSEELKTQMLLAWRSRELSLWRFILDLHSGRFFGTAGVFVVDLVAVGLLLLVLTGLRTRRHKPRREP